MLRAIAGGVWVHQSACIETNSIVIEGADGVLVVDPGLTEVELSCLVGDLAELAQTAVAGFSTHPDWDHVLWHDALGQPPRYATAAGEASMRALLAQPDWREQVNEALPPEIAGEVPTALFGQLTALPAGATELPWNGPEMRLIEHRAHAEGHAALYAPQLGLLVAGDMLSDVLVPMPDMHGADDPLGDYLKALRLFEQLADRVSVFVPGHGAVGDADDLRARIDQDRAYVQSLIDGTDIDDPRLGANARPGWEWVDGIHEWHRSALNAT